jgi:ribosomal protein L37AE/L43A
MLVTIAKYRKSGDAERVRAALAAEGIAAAIDGEHLLVDAADVERADAVLNRMYDVEHAERVTPSDTEARPDPRECPNCGSRAIRRVPRLAIFAAAAAIVVVASYVWTESMTESALLAILSLAVLFLIFERWRCDDCGSTWR